MDCGKKLLKIFIKWLNIEALLNTADDQCDSKNAEIKANTKMCLFCNLTMYCKSWFSKLYRILNRKQQLQQI